MHADHIVSSGSPHNNVLHFSSILLIGASLSEPHIDELNVRNLYNIIIIIMVRTSPARRYRDCTGVRDIFQHDLEAA